MRRKSNLPPIKEMLSTGGVACPGAALKERTSLEIFAHSPYSPDLALCDFCLFPKIIKKKLREKWFTDAEEAVAEYEKAVEATPKCEREKCLSAEIVCGCWNVLRRAGRYAVRLLLGVTKCGRDRTRGRWRGTAFSGGGSLARGHQIVGRRILVWS
ncbi:hypothetical protein EVAR_35407_1 [Eumeta japonica]|uniref:Histone-lysine N-methyltransferase SETMAR n=1 Tax=Eumeta variegata TaxID=151549 RepID=A0A4C1X6P4_EUMVA|nr:hypothetical protein EVAR_35407_1 [Eumeta japonica]